MAHTIPYAEAESLQFGLMTTEDINERALVELDRIHGGKKSAPIPHTMNCATLGASSASALCSKCGSDLDACQGHFGKLTLWTPVYSVSYFHIILKVLSSLCIRCGRALLPDNHPKRKRMFRMGHTTSYKRCVNEMFKHTSRNRVCWFPTDGRDEAPHMLSDAEANERGYCGMRQPDLWFRDDNLIVRPVFYIRQPEHFDDLPIIPPAHVLSMLKSVSPYTTRMFGFHPKHSPLHALMIEVMVVPPVLTRLPRGAHGNKDDLTVTLEVVQEVNADADREVVPNTTLGLLLKEGMIEPGTVTAAKKQLVHVEGEMSKKLLRAKKPIMAACLDDFYRLQRAVASLTDSKYDKKFDGEFGKERFCLKRRFVASKRQRGRMRQNMLGKATKYTIRAVASPRTDMEIYQIGIPKQALMHCTFPVVVTEINFNDMLKCVLNGADKYPGCKYVERDGQLYLPDANFGGLKPKDIVHKHWEFPVIGNRHPSLHRFAIMGYEVIVSEGNTMQGHLAVSTVLNEDFDGDEKNAYLPQDLMVLAEAMHLMSVRQNLMKDGCLVIGFVQHAVLGAYKLTDEHKRKLLLTSRQIQRYLGLGFRRECLEPVLERWETFNHMQDLTGREFMHILLPTYNPAVHNDALTKSSLNACMGATIESMQDMHYAADRIGFLTRILEAVCYDCGMTMHIDDCHIASLPDSIEAQAEAIYKDACLLAECKRTETNAEEQRALEQSIITLTSKYRDVKGRYALRVFESASRACGMYDIVTSKAKGSAANLTQNVIVVGQQINEQNVRYQDTTSHYFRDPLARHGFIHRSFYDGPSPVEYFHHSRASRIGLVAIPCGTALSGYTYRQLLKCVEAVRVSYRNSVCNDTGDVLLFHYGFDPTFANTIALVSVTLDINDTVHAFATDVDACSVEEVEHLLELRARVIEYDPTLTVSAPIRFVKSMFCAADGCDLEPITRNAARNRVAKLWKKLVVEDNIPNDSAIECMFFEQMSSKLLHERGYLCCAHVFEAYLEHVAHALASNVAPTGDPVGPKASQDPTQHFTQTNLKGFHFSGEKTTHVDNMTRAKEILNLRPNLQQPLTYMHILPEFEATFNPLDIMELRLVKVVRKCMDTPLHPNFWDIVRELCPNSEKLLACEYTEDAVAHVALFLDKPWMERRELTPRMLAHYVCTVSLVNVDPFASAVTYTTNLDDEEWTMTISMTREAAAPLLKTFKKDFHMLCKTLPLPMLSLYLQHTLLHSCELLAGVDSITDFLKTTRRVLVSDEANDGRLAMRMLPCYVLMGSNLQAICSLPEVDITYTTTNNIHQIFQEFGIAAAQKAIEDNLVEVIESEDKQVALQHIKIIAATMCQCGYPAPLTFAGMTSQETATWFKRATFERHLDSFFGAGIQGHKDNLAGVSEAIVVGALVSVGTGGEFELIADEEKMRNEGFVATARSRMRFDVPDIDKFLREDNGNGPCETIRLYFDRKNPETKEWSFHRANKKRKLKTNPDDDPDPDELPAQQQTYTCPEAIAPLQLLYDPNDVSLHIPKSPERVPPVICKAEDAEGGVDLYYGPAFMLVPPSPKPRKKNESRRNNKRRFGERDLTDEGLHSLEHYFETSSSSFSTTTTTAASSGAKPKPSKSSKKSKTT